MGGLPGMANLGMGSANLMEMQQRLSSEMLSNPDMLRSVMDSPLTQSLMSNPEIMRGLMQSNPQMQQVTSTAACTFSPVAPFCTASTIYFLYFLADGAKSRNQSHDEQSRHPSPDYGDC